jgi:hypothetical protein
MRVWKRGTYEDKMAYLKASKKPTVKDIAWAAGFLEGEGGFRLNNQKAKVAHVHAVQVQREPLDRVRAFFGGSVNRRKGRPHQNDYWEWVVTGARARGVMMTIYTFMSPRRKQQMKKALGHFELEEA